MDIREPFTDQTYESPERTRHVHRQGTRDERDRTWTSWTEHRIVPSSTRPSGSRYASPASLGCLSCSTVSESHDEAFRVLREERAYEVGGVMHYFQGDLKTATEGHGPRLLHLAGTAPAASHIPSADCGQGATG